MSINNLHSLLSDKWFIEASFANALLPSLSNILSGNNLSIPESKKTPEVFAFSLSSNSVTALENNSENQQEDYILILSLKNPIFKYNQSCGPTGTKEKSAILNQHKNNPNCIGVVFDIDSGGGQVSGTPEFYDIISNYPKPTIAYTDGYMCSAAYYIGNATDYIVANKRADSIGSIGSMVSLIDTRGYYEKKGAKVITAYATKSTEKNKNYRDLLDGKPENYINNVLDPITEVFHKDMISKRPTITEVSLKGGVYNATDALKNGLIDVIGTMQTAIDKVYEIHNKNKTTPNTNNAINMAKLNIPNIENAIGDKFSEGETEAGILLTDEQANALETQLSNYQTQIENLTNKNQQLSNYKKNVSDALATALETEDFANEAAATDADKVVLLSNKIKEYGGKDGASLTTTTPAEGTQENTNVISGIDITGALNN